MTWDRLIILSICCAALLVAAGVACSQSSKPRLLSTESVARKVHEISDKLLAPSAEGDYKLDQRRRERDFERLKQLVSDFVVNQLQAEPALEESQLRNQLRRILSDPYEPLPSDPEGRFRSAPYVFKAVNLNKDQGTVWAVRYRGDVWNGLRGARTVIDSYVTLNGSARLVGRGGREMAGYGLQAELIYNPNSVSILAHGVRQWSSGRALPTAATLYEVTAGGVKKLWGLEAASIAFIGAENMLFCIGYEDSVRYSKNLPSDAVDCYAVNRTVPYRVVHQFVDYQATDKPARR